MKNLFFSFISFICITSTYAQIGIKADATAPIPSAQLEVQSTTKAFYPPRMTTSQRTTLPNAPQKGAVVFDTDLNSLFIFNGISWVASGLTLPYSVSQSEEYSNLLRVENTSTTTSYPVIIGVTNTASTSSAIIGSANNQNPTGFSSGVKGSNYSTNANGYGIYGEHFGSGYGVAGATANGTGVIGFSNGGVGGNFYSSSGYALITGTGNVGIGIPVPLEKLHVSGNIRASSLAGTGVRDVKADANGTLITTPQTYTISIGPTAFSPINNNSGTFTSLGAANSGFMSVGSTDILAAPVLLPDGANITSVTLYYINTSTTAKFSCTLNANPYQVISFSNIFSGTTTATSATSNTIVSSNLNSISSSPINNSTNSYFINLFPVTVSTGAATTWVTGMSLKGVKITYTL